MSRRRTGPLLVLRAAAMLAPETAQAQPTRLEVELSYAADAGCPEMAAFKAIVSGRLQYDPFVETASHRAHVQLKRFDDAVRAHIEWRDASSGAWAGEQNLQRAANECEALVRATAFALSVHIEFLTNRSADDVAAQQPQPSDRPPKRHAQQPQKAPSRQGQPPQEHDDAQPSRPLVQAVSRPPQAPVSAEPPAPSTSQVPALPGQSFDGTKQWQVGALSALDHFTDGTTLAGADLFVAARFRRYLVGEVRGGGRLAAARSIPSGHLTVRAATVSAAAGVDALPGTGGISLRLMLRAQAYLVRFGGVFPASGAADSAVLGTSVVALEPRLDVVVNRRLTLALGAAIGVAVPGIGVRIQGNDSAGLSGAVVSAQLGAAVSF